MGGGGDIVSLAWGGHQNGRIPIAQLRPIGVDALGLDIGKQQYAHPAAAARWKALVDAVESDTGVRMGVASGYRDLDAQRRYHNEYGPGRAAAPGTSNHGWGRAIDMHGYTAAALRSVRKHAGRLGWSLATGDRIGEPWHIEYVGPLVLPTPPTPPRDDEREDDMIRTIRYLGKRKEWAIIDPRRKGGVVRTTNVRRAHRLAALYVTNWNTGPRNGWDYQTKSYAEFTEILNEARLAHEDYVALFGTAS